MYLTPYHYQTNHIDCSTWRHCKAPYDTDVCLECFFYSVLENKAHYLNDSNGKKKSSLKAICELAYGLLEPNILVLYVSQKKKKRKRKDNGTLSLNIKQGMIFSSQGDFKEGRYFWEWSSQLDLTAPRTRTDPKSCQKTLQPRPRLCSWKNVFLNQCPVNLGILSMQYTLCHFGKSIYLELKSSSVRN